MRHGKIAVVTVIACFIAIFSLGTAKATGLIAFGDGWTLDSEGTLTISDNHPSSFDEYKESIVRAVLDDSVTAMPDLSGLPQLESVYIGINVERINQDLYYSVGDKKLYSYEVDSQNPYFTSLEGVIFDKEMKTLIRCPNAKAGIYTIPDGVTTLQYLSFWVCESLEEIIIPNTVTTIEESAFSSCSSLREITIPDSVSEIEKYAFSHCEALETVVIGNGLTCLRYETFEECEKLSTVVLGSGIETIEALCFTECYSLANVKWNAGLKYIGNQAFDYTALTELILPDGVEEIGQYAFSGSDLQKVVLPDSVTKLGYGVFQRCRDLISVKLSAGLTEITGSNIYGDVGLFSECSSLESVVIPEGVKEIGRAVFQGCSSLKQIVIPDGVTKIHEKVFEFCPAIPVIHCNINSVSGVQLINLNGVKICDASYPDFVFKVTVEESGTYLSVYDYCGKKDVVDIPAAVYGYPVVALMDKSFENCVQLRHVRIPASVKMIGNDCFLGCSLLESITIPEHVESIGQYAFANCSCLDYVLLPESVGLIGDNAFVNVPGILYCYEFSYAESWANANGYGDQIVLLDVDTYKDILSLKLPEYMEIKVGETLSNKLSVFPADSDVPIQWHSSAPEIISVDQMGEVSGLKSGEAVITAQAANVTATMTVKAYVALESFFVPEEMYIVAKEEAAIQLQQFPSDAEDIFTYSSSNPIYASVTEDGLVTAKAVGDVTIAVQAQKSQLSQNCLVHVCYPVTNVELEQTELDLEVDRTVQLIANVTMRTQNCVNHLVTFASSDELIASINQYGEITGIANGITTITATASNGISASCIVNVREHVHVETVDAAVSPTCTATGLTEGKHCSVCSEVLVKQETVSALGHTEVIDEAVSPTCTATGLTEGKHCSVCSEVLVKQETVSALGHTEVIDEAVAPTTTTTGLTVGEHCSVCGEVLVVQEVVPILANPRTIGAEAYAGSDFHTVYLPDGYTAIESRAFANCLNLQKIYIPASVRTIASDAFDGCAQLTICAPERSYAISFAEYRHIPFVEE